MAEHNDNNIDFTLPGVPLPKRLSRPLGMREVSSLSETGREVARLRAIHPDLSISFRALDLQNMDEATLRIMLEQMRELIGIGKQPE